MGCAASFPRRGASSSRRSPKPERHDLLTAYASRLNHSDPAVHMPAARAWSVYEGRCSTLLPNAEALAYFSSDHVALGLARIEAHYFRHRLFLPENALLNNLQRYARSRR